MGTVERAIEVLRQAERRLRDLVGEAATTGDYDTVERVADLARGLGEMTRARRPDKPPRTSASAQAHKSNRRSVTSTGAAPGRRGRGRRRSNASRRQPPKGEYPKFFRRDDQLVKIGWSKKQRQEYEHKAPRRVVEALAAAIGRRSGNGRLFTSDEVMPLQDADTGEELPGYQAYLALAWFTKAGLIQKHGRSGYSVANGTRLPTAVTACWHKLPESRFSG